MGQQRFLNRKTPTCAPVMWGFSCSEIAATPLSRFDFSTYFSQSLYQYCSIFRYPILGSIILVWTTLSRLGTPEVKERSFRTQTVAPTGFFRLQRPFVAYLGNSPRQVCEILGAQVCNNPQGWSFCGVADPFYLYLPFGAHILFQVGCSSSPEWLYIHHIPYWMSFSSLERPLYWVRCVLCFSLAGCTTHQQSYRFAIFAH